MTHRMMGILGLAAILTMAIPSLHGQAQGSANESRAQVNLNTASTVELERLPGVGPAMAARIVEYRQKNGGFKKIEELMNIQGIGEKRFLDLKPQITITPIRAAQ